MDLMRRRCDDKAAGISGETEGLTNLHKDDSGFKGASADSGQGGELV